MPAFLALHDLRAANVDRFPQFKNRRGVVYHKTPTVHDWTLAQWSNATLGELGEAANIVKKIDRGDFGDDISAIRPALASELADTIIYLDMYALRADIDLAAAVVKAFNDKSVEVGATTRLPVIHI